MVGTEGSRGRSHQAEPESLGSNHQGHLPRRKAAFDLLSELGFPLRLLPLPGSYRRAEAQTPQTTPQEALQQLKIRPGLGLGHILIPSPGPGGEPPKKSPGMLAPPEAGSQGRLTSSKAGRRKALSQDLLIFNAVSPWRRIPF